MKLCTLFKQSVYAFILCAFLLRAEVITTYYVDVNNGSDNAAGTTWGTARKTIQSAINSAADGCTILVTNGVYEPITCTSKALSIQSVCGAFSTTIDALGAARRCADLGSGVSLVGFTLQNGKLSITGSAGGGGARGGILRNCVIRNNSGRDGGGVQSSECHNCLIYGNNAMNGGGAGNANNAMYNCTIVGNVARDCGGGIAGGNCYNCIITGNTANIVDTVNTAEGIWGGTFRSCAIGSQVSFVNAADRDYRLAVGSSCIDAGNNSYVADSDTDLDGNVRISGGRVDIGCFEFTSLDVINVSMIIAISTANPAWIAHQDESLGYVYIATSAAIPDGTNSWMKTIVTGPGKLSFDWKVSCENRYAYLQLLVDGVQSKRITGAKDWASVLLEIGAGEHEIKWNYVKDGAAAVGEDAGFVRDISWRPYLAFSSVTAHGAALPADNDALLYGDAIDASVNAAVTDGDVRYDCTGWIGTGSAPETGTSNNCSFVLKEDSSLTWLWRTNYWTSVTVGGPAAADFAEGWLAAGDALTVALAPAVPYYAFALSGDTSGVTLDGTNIVFVADRPRAIAVTARELTIPGALGTTNLAWRTGGDAVWFPEASVTSDGLDAAQSGALDAKGASWLETTVIGPGTLAFKWRFAPGSANSGIDLLIDGNYEDGLTDATGGWEDYSLEIGAGRHVVRWEFYGADGENGTAWLDQLTWSGGHPVPTYTSVNVTGPATADFTGGLLEDSSNMVVRITPEVNYYRISILGDTEGVTLDGTVLSFEVTGPRTINVLVEELTLEAALDSTGVKWRTGGDAVWFPEPDTTSDGIDAAQSGMATDKGVSWVETTVIGPGTLSFQWKLATDGTRSGIDLLVDGDYEDGLEADSGWTVYELDIGSGSHVVRWEYWNQDAGASGTAWLDQVAWDGAYPTATSTTPDPVPYVWLDANAKSFVTRFYGDYEAAAYATAANTLNSVYECYVAGLAPTNATDVFRAVISIGADGEPIIGWEPDLNEGGTKQERVYTVEGRESFTDDDWAPTNSASRFFRVKVSMP